MAFTDKKLTCVDCEQEFVFSVKEQEFFESKGFTNSPKRCNECRETRKSSRNRETVDQGYVRKMYPAVCAQCKKQTKVPFQPNTDRPVYCSSCYSSISVSK